MIIDISYVFKYTYACPKLVILEYILKYSFDLTKLKGEPYLIGSYTLTRQFAGRK